MCLYGDIHTRSDRLLYGQQSHRVEYAQHGDADVGEYRRPHVRQPECRQYQHSGLDGEREDKEHDFQQVRGSAFESDPFVVSIKDHIQNKNALGDRVVSLMQAL